ncbi:Rv3235 family protein [Streptomyces sp. NPDC059477]|uniref:Rv3235 family protein n=1 Tax=Streptomyces sp. NPDC059477 TaxID=3346847 RepID=UPI0036CD7E43
MNKVMTRAQAHAQRPSRTRPPGRRDSRRPGTAPPRFPGVRRPGPGTPAGTTTPTTPPASPLTPMPTSPPAPITTPGTGTGATPTTPTVPHQAPRGPRPALPTEPFAERLLAVLSGARPVHYMLGLTSGRAYDELAWLAERGPLRTTRGVRPVLREIGWYEAGPGAIEVFARIGAGDRLRAMAFRLELGDDRRWRCTAVDLGGPPLPQNRSD